MKKLIYCLALLCPFFGACQTITIKGNVINEEGTPVPAASISIKGTPNSTVANSKGEFTLAGTKLTDSLIVSAVGYQTITEPNNMRGLITVILKRKAMPLKVGDTIPHIILTDVINFPVSKIHLSQLKGKLVVFDFFATWCAPCVLLLPKLQQLQKQFGERMQIIVVTHEPKEKIKNFLQSKKAHGITLPFAVADTVLKKYFPHTLIPHEVILNPMGKVAAITHHDYITAANMAAILEGKHVSFPAKQDIVEFNANKTFYTAFAEGLVKPSFSSTIIQHIPGAGSGYRKQLLDNSMSLRTSYFNLPLLSLYEQATGIEIKNRLLLQTTDSSKYFRFDAPESIWVPANTFCYELIAPNFFTAKQRSRAMMETLNHYFSINGSVEKRNMHCWAIVQKGDASKLRSKGGKPFSNLNEKNGELKQLVNKPLSALINYLNNTRGKAIVFDETGFTGNVDIAFPIPDLFDLQALKNILLNYDLDIIPVQREVEMLVLTDI